MKNRKIKILQQRLKRKNIKIKNIQDVLSVLKERNKCTRDLEQVLQNNFAEFTLDLVKHELFNQNSSKSQRHYSADMKKFALTVYFYSPKAYNYLRTKIMLPHSSQIRKWLSSHNCETGFLSEVFEFLKANVNDNSHMQNVALIFASMAIRSQIVYDKKMINIAAISITVV